MPTAKLNHKLWTILQCFVSTHIYCVVSVLQKVETVLCAYCELLPK